MKWNNNLLVFIPAYTMVNEIDSFMLGSLRNQTNKQFTLLFIDPHLSENREKKIKDFEKETNIQSLYFPYRRDIHRRKWDWAIMNVPFMFFPSGRVLRYQQNRIISAKLIETVVKTRGNIGFERMEIVGEESYPPTQGDVNLCYKIGDAEGNVRCRGGMLHADNIGARKSDDPANSYGDWCLDVEQFLSINGIDEAMTATYHFEDIDFNMRWKIAHALGLVQDVSIVSHMMLWFHGRNRKFDNIKNNPILQRCQEYAPCAFCDMEPGRQRAVDDAINTKFINNIESHNFFGEINGKEWFECKHCGLVLPRLGHPHFSAFKDRIIEKKCFKATIGVGGYGRNLMKIRNDVQGLNSWEQKVELINSSWNNRKYYQ